MILFIVSSHQLNLPKSLFPASVPQTQLYLYHKNPAHITTWPNTEGAAAVLVGRALSLPQITRTSLSVSVSVNGGKNSKGEKKAGSRVERRRRVSEKRFLRGRKCGKHFY